MTTVSSLSCGEQVHFEDIVVGLAIPELVVTPTVVQLFRFSAVTWNSHRIHYDRETALAEGHPDILVQAHLHGAFLARALNRWSGNDSRLRRFAWKNRARAIPGDTLTCRATVSRIEAESNGGVVELALTETNQRGETCATGTAVIWLPCRRTAVRGAVGNAIEVDTP